MEMGKGGEKGRNDDDKKREEGETGSGSERRKGGKSSEARIPRQVLRSGVTQQR